MAAQPAYIAVPARQSTASKPASGFPEPIVEYVQRAFGEFNKNKHQLARVGISLNDVRAKLASIVNTGTKDGLVDSRDWSSYKLPHEFIIEARDHAALHLTQAQAVANLFNQSAGLPADNEYPSGAVNGRKRKSPDAERQPADNTARAVTPPWKKKNSGVVSLADRITGKSKPPEKKRKESSNAQGGMFDNSQDVLERRRQRFGQVSSEPSPYVSSRDDSPSADANSGPVVGTCQTLEKSYFRLTAPPNPNTVRPLPVLEQALDLVKQKWRQNSDYQYVCDQLKSLRQDLTVQRIKGPFTIKVYELHARIALQMKDLGEYNQCQTQLRALYKLNPGGRDSRDEFLAYRILYLVYTRSRTDMNDTLADLTTADKQKPIVQHALQVRAAVASGNYHKFFKLYSKVQDMHMVPYLLDMFVERERTAAMAVICRAYKPDVNLEFLASELAFDVDEDTQASVNHGAAGRCYEFLCRHGSQSLVTRKDGGETRFQTSNVGAVFESARKQTVDIQGQI